MKRYSIPSKDCGCARDGKVSLCRAEDWRQERTREPARFTPDIIERAIKVCEAVCRLKKT